VEASGRAATDEGSGQEAQDVVPRMKSKPEEHRGGATEPPRRPGERLTDGFIRRTHDGSLPRLRTLR